MASVVLLRLDGLGQGESGGGGEETDLSDICKVEQTRLAEGLEMARGREDSLKVELRRAPGALAGWCLVLMRITGRGTNLRVWVTHLV